MEWWPVVTGVAVAAVALVIAQRRGWIDLSNKARSSGTRGMIGAIDEVFAPTRLEAHIELEAQTRLPAPAPVPGDGPDEEAGYSGRLRIDLSGESDPGTPDAPPGSAS